jgi:hypothetical protein
MLAQLADSNLVHVLHSSTSAAGRLLRLQEAEQQETRPLLQLFPGLRPPFSHRVRR